MSVIICLDETLEAGMRIQTIHNQRYEYVNFTECQVRPSSLFLSAT